MVFCVCLSNCSLHISGATTWRLPRWHSDKKICLPMQDTKEMQTQSLVWEGPLE